MLDSLINFLQGTGVAQLTRSPEWLKLLAMYVIALVLVYLAIAKKYEPLLLLPIAIGMLLTNLPGANLFPMEFFLEESIDYGKVLHDGGLLDLLYLGVKLGLYPSIIFIGIGAMTDFTPLIADPKNLLIGAGAQFGVFAAFSGALISGVFTPEQAASIGIVGGADGPTSIMLTKILAPSLLGAIAIAAYSYMALIPMIQPPVMRLLTTKKERIIRKAAAQAHAGAGGQLCGLDRTVVKAADGVFDVFFKHVVAGFVVSSENGVGKIQHVAPLYKRGIACGLGVVGGVLVTRIMSEGAAEIGLEHLGHSLAVAFGLVGA